MMRSEPERANLEAVNVCQHAVKSMEKGGASASPKGRIVSNRPPSAAPIPIRNPQPALAHSPFLLPPFRASVWPSQRMQIEAGTAHGPFTGRETGFTSAHGTWTGRQSEANSPLGTPTGRPVEAEPPHGTSTEVSVETRWPSRHSTGGRVEASLPCGSSTEAGAEASFPSRPCVTMSVTNQTTDS
jgi:hypothetical protein